MAGVRRRALDRGRGGLGGAVARLPPPRARRKALGRPAVGGSRRRAASVGRHRPRPRLRHRRASHDPALPRAAARARAGKPARRRLRLRRPLDRRRPARLRAGSAASTPIAAAVEATRANALANGVDVARRAGRGGRAALPAAEVAVANISAAAVRALAGRVDAAHLITSGYMEPDEPRAARATGASSAGSSRAGPATCTPAADSPISFAPAAAVRSRGDELQRRLSRLQGLACGRPGDPRAAARGRPRGPHPRGPRRRARRCRRDQHVLRHERGGRQEPQGRRPRRAGPRPRLSHGLRGEPGRRRRSPGSPRTSRSSPAGARRRPRSSPVTSARSAACRPTPASTASAPS